MSITLTDQDKFTLRTAAYGAVTLMSAADAAGKPHKAATEGSIALASATGLVGHVLADNVLPALTAAMNLLKQQDPAEAANFRSTVLVAVETAARTHQGRPSPTLADMTRKITEALDAA